MNLQETSSRTDPGESCPGGKVGRPNEGAIATTCVHCLRTRECEDLMKAELKRLKAQKADLEEQIRRRVEKICGPHAQEVLSLLDARDKERKSILDDCLKALLASRGAEVENRHFRTLTP